MSIGKKVSRSEVKDQDHSEAKHFFLLRNNSQQSTVH